jgi:hypothetical protein
LTLGNVESSGTPATPHDVSAESQHKEGKNMNSKDQIDFVRKALRWLSREFPDLDRWLNHHLSAKNYWVNDYIRRNSAVGSVLHSLFIAVLVSISLFTVIAVAHLMLKSGRPKARVFISYRYYDRNDLAERAEQELAKLEVEVSRLPFKQAAEHDAMIDEIYNAIRSSDILLCIPGASESFIESEIAFAYGQRKPVILLLDPDNSPRVPNTAKKGIPVFHSKSVEKTEYNALAEFCSYLAADRRSTAALYRRAFLRAGSVSSIAVPLCFVSTIYINAYIKAFGDKSVVDWSLFIVPYSVILILAFATSLLVTIGSRAVARQRLKKAITGKRFTPEDLPIIMPGDLREKLIDCLYTGELKGLHERR